MRWARDKRKLTQPQLASLAHVSQGTIGNIESGARKRPRDLVGIARALNVSPDWLDTGRGDWQPGKVAPGAALEALTEDERAVLEDFRILTDSDKERFAREIAARAKELREYLDQVLAKTRTVSPAPAAPGISSPPKDKVS